MSETYHFVKLKCHPKIPDLFGWYLAITQPEIDLFMKCHRSAVGTLFMKFHNDPHLFDQKTFRATSEHSHFFNPVKLGAGWLMTAQKAIFEHGIVYMNKCHGLTFGKVEIVEELVLNELRFPLNDEEKKDTIITVSRWGSGTHYYLRANNGQVFSQPKFDTMDEALVEARKFALEKNIRVKENFSYARDGD